MTAAAEAHPDERPVALEVSLMGRAYRVACKESERAELTEAVALVDARMREVRDQGKIAGAERIAVMVALNLAHDILRERHSGAGAAPRVDAAASRRRIAKMHSAIDGIIADQEKLL